MRMIPIAGTPRTARRVVAVAVIVVPLLLAAALPAQTGAPVLSAEQAREAEKAMSQLRSPVTPSHTVDMCPSTGALRDSIRAVAATGAPAEAMIEGVIARHGEHLRIVPKRTGAGLLAWLATPLLVIAGGALIFGRVRRDGRAAAARPRPETHTEIDDADRARLAAAMRQLDDDGGLDP